MSSTVKDAKIIKSPLARLSYPNLFEMQEFADGKKSYSLVMLIPKTEGFETQPRKDPVLRSLYEALKTAALEQWKGDIPKALKLPIKDGDVARDGEAEAAAECQGMWIIGASTKNRPGIVRGDLTYIAEKDNEMYPGCWVYVKVRAFAWTNQYKKSGCSFGLRNVQKVRDGERLGGAAPAHDDFEPIAEAESTASYEEPEGDDGTF